MTDSIYIHIPFCKYICSYCDFCKKYIKNQDIKKYFDFLKHEINLYSIEEPIETIYIGGGTPSAIELPILEDFLIFLNSKISLKEEYEFTFECNPDDVSIKLMTLLSNHNVNRISMGVQTLNDDILSKINRDHTSLDVQKAIDITHPLINNISIDLIYNLPGQTLEDIEKSFKFIKLNKSKLNHVSYYSLILEDNTMLPPDFYNFEEDVEEKIYQSIIEKLKIVGYNQYEISNFSKPGFSSIHNQKYWMMEHYYGFGLGASGYLKNQRHTNTKSLNEYYSLLSVNKLPILEKNIVTEEDKLEETILVGLRTNKGIKEELLKDIKIKEKYFIRNEGLISINPKYYFISNEIIVDILEKI